MADLSDDINDLMKYNLMDKKILAVLGSRFLRDSVVKGYPLKKLILNRIFTFFKVLYFEQI